jgi:hypothetical protein
MICRFLLALTAASACLLAADPALVRMIPPEAAFVAGVRADQVRNSRFGQTILDQLKREEVSLNRFIEATGFDPRIDLNELIIASNDAKKKGNGLALARGRFNAGRIQSFARAEGGQSSQFLGVDVLTMSGKNGAVAILDPSIAVAGDEESVKAAIQRHRQAGPASLEARMLARITELSATYDAWLVSPGIPQLAGNIGDPQMAGAMRGNLAQSVESVVGGLRFAPGTVELMAEAGMRSEKDAAAMVDVVRFLAGLLQLNSGNDPRAAELTKMLDRMQLSSSGNVFRMQLTVPDDFIDKLVRPASRKTAPVI